LSNTFKRHYNKVKDYASQSERINGEESKMSSEDNIEESKTEHSDCLNADLKREFIVLINWAKFYESLDTTDD
jgi:hypothetical protein